MKENETKIQKLMPMILIAFCVIVVLWGCHFYLASVQNSLVEQSIGNVMTVTQQQEEAFDSFLYRDMVRMHSLMMWRKFMIN